jgi:DNA-binding response OmpR family regulator
MGDNPVRRARIAVINDDTAFLELMRILLQEEEDFEVLICKEWNHAYQFVKDEQPDLIIQTFASAAKNTAGRS